MADEMKCCSLDRRGHLHSPYFIFIRDHVSDKDLLELLGIAAAACPLESHTQIEPHLFMTEDDAWVHVVDDWNYTLWHTHVIDVLHKRLPSATIFACSVEDCD